MAAPNKRREMDLTKLMKNHKVDLVNDEMEEFHVYLHGPNHSLYQGGVWKIHVELLEGYPNERPIVTFATPIYHPNIDPDDGVICLDVLEEWRPTYDLVNVFQHFLPQLLLCPNPSEPLNDEAASLMIRDKIAYKQKVKDYLEEHAKPLDGCVPEEDRPTNEEMSKDDSKSNDDEAIPDYVLKFAEESTDEETIGDVSEYNNSKEVLDYVLKFTEQSANEETIRDVSACTSSKEVLDSMNAETGR